MVGFDRYGFYAGFNTPQINILAGLKPSQGAWGIKPACE
jgi:hypothetical protein